MQSSDIWALELLQKPFLRLSNWHVRGKGHAASGLPTLHP